MRMRHAGVLWPALLAACSTDVQTYALKHTTPAERSFAAHYLALLAGSKIDSAAALLSPELQTDTARRIATQVGALLATAQLDSLHYIGLNIFENLGTHLRELNLSYEGPTTDRRWVVASVATRYSADKRSVFGFSAYPVAQPLEATNAFTLSHRSPIHFVWLTLALLMPVVTIGCAVWLLRTRMPRRWLWALVALITTPAFGLNWTTGQFTHQLNLFTLFGGAALRAAPAAPWIITFGVPLGAIVSYSRWRAWHQASAREPTSPAVAA